MFHAAIFALPPLDSWSKIFKCLWPGAHLIVYFEPTDYHRGVIEIEGAGFEIRDQIQFIGTEPLAICLARKPLSEKTVAKNVLKFGTGGLNIDASRIGLDGTENLNARQTTTKLSKEKFFDTETREFEGQQTYNAAGRFPANVIFDEDAAAVLDEQTEGTRAGKPSGTGKIGAAKGGAYSLFGNDGATTSRYDDQNVTGASRFFKVVKNKEELFTYLKDLVLPPSGVLLSYGFTFHDEDENAA